MSAIFLVIEEHGKTLKTYYTLGFSVILWFNIFLIRRLSKSAFLLHCGIVALLH